MFVKCNFLVLNFCSLLALVISAQIRLANDNKDNSNAANYDNYAPDAYSYNYGISDQATGDRKSKWEKRENGVVRGAYTVLEPDGSTRLVEYTADQNGFHPVVSKLEGSSRNLPPIYNVNTPNLGGVYNGPDLTYRNQYDQGSNYNNAYIYNDDGRQNAYNRRPFLNTGYYNRGYDGFYGGRDDSYVAPARYHPALRQEQQPVPLLHSSYHGYDNLYH